MRIDWKRWCFSVSLYSGLKQWKSTGLVSSCHKKSSVSWSAKDSRRDVAELLVGVFVCSKLRCYSAAQRRRISAPKVWKRVVVAISAGFGKFLWYEEGEGALYRGQILSSCGLLSADYLEGGSTTYIGPALKPGGAMSNENMTSAELICYGVRNLCFKSAPISLCPPKTLQLNWL